MRLVLPISRPKPLFFVECLSWDAVISGRPTTIVASTHEQAMRTYEAAKSLVNGCDPRTAPG